MNKLVLSVGMMFTLAGTAAAQQAEPAAPSPPVATEPRPVVAPAPVIVEKPKPVEKPPAPKPVVPAKPATEPAVTVPAPAASPALTDNAAPASSGCQPLSLWLTGFAMLLIGFAAGFIVRHQVSRRKLGGMTVRIGTWRGIP